MLMMALAMMGSDRLQAQNSTLTGVVQDASGQPVAGALVKVKNSDAGLTFMVVSQAQGRFITPILPPGSYMVQGFGGGYQSSQSGPVELSEDQQGKANLELSNPHKTVAPGKKMTDTDFAKLMPEGDGKQLVRTQCVLCHGLDRVVPTRHTREQWQHTVDRMRSFINERSDLQNRINRGPLSDQEWDLVRDYLADNFGMDKPRLPRKGPPDPNQHFSSTLLQGTEAKFIAMELELPSNRDEYEVAIDSKGTAWISERETSMFGRFDPETFTYTRLSTPPGQVPRLVAQIGVDPRDHVWILDNGLRPKAELLEYDPKTEEFNIYEIPAPPVFGYAPLNTLRFLDGDVWGPGNVSNRIVKLDPSTGEVSLYPVPKGSHPYGIDVGPDKMVYYVAMYDDEVVRLDPKTGQLTPFRVPTRKSGLRRMGADAEGNLWVGAQNIDKLVKVDPRTGEATEYTVPTKYSGVYTADVDKEHNLIWFVEREADRIGRFDPASNTFVEFPLVTAGTESRRIPVDKSNPNRIWFTGRRIGYIEVVE